MKKVLFCALAIAVLAAFAAYAGPFQKKAMGIYTADTLGTGTSADTVISLPFDIAGVSWLGAEIFLDVASGGGSGGGIIYVQGRVGTRAWQNLWFCDYSDSLAMTTGIAVASTADIQEYITITTQPYQYNLQSWGLNTKLPMQVNFDTDMPFEQVRLYVADANWNADCHVYGSWLYKK